MTQTLPDDYDKADGFNEEKAIEQCPHCEQTYSPNGGYLGPVWDQSGRRYDHHTDSDPSDGPFFCQDCWHELEANQKRAENQSLGDFA